ncbi:FAD-binding and (Fe-S)-binding domain-containing protein [Isoptericola sp. b441]|uniref:FAD-binding and (Fe-S)-binding domain-containing protein n=1 Tax=Actinotalea lenta TaxID=3064654 RepID=A0ABT9D8K1_9CELL|nr:FAD-binding and (Fe-S)-binding domain-containing protein [Isoptericola sp. b441]MDO8107225.1 FAD-binding and (Fe-S)-binding domain-containing protein [Isoptericola sp. b441]
MTVDLPAPTRRDDLADLDLRELERRLTERVDGEVRFDAGSRGTYATDASNFRQVPLGVVIPRTVEAGAAAVEVCAQLGAPIVSRGGGTSLAGEACNVAVVLDWSKYCKNVVSVDPDARTAVVEPGIVLDELNKAVAPHGLQFGPRPSTHSRCTLGGMIGNNSCGSTAQAYGKTVDNLVRAEVLTYDGVRMWVGPTSDEEYQQILAEGGRRAEIYRGLHEIAEEYGDDVRSSYPDIPRRVSGYNLDSLLPEGGFDLAKALSGSEGTLVTLLRAEVALVPVVEHRAMLVLGFPSIEEAADAVPMVNGHEPLVVEGIDERLIHFEREKRLNQGSLDLLPGGLGWLMVEVGADDEDELRREVESLAADAEQAGAHVQEYEDAEDREDLWSIRESGLGATAWVADMADAWPGWEDSAVPPERLGEYLRRFGDLLDEYGYGKASRYGHFGHGCLHIRIPFDLTTAEGVQDYVSFLDRAAHLVAEFGGSLSGEHGDGQQRGALLPVMLGDRCVEAMEKVKALVDPGNRMNPGKVVHAYAPDENLRLGPDYAPSEPRDKHFRFPQDDGSWDRAVLRCVGVGQCRSHEGGVMCPSYRATGEEQHSTRGRSRLLFEMMSGHPDSPITDGWRSTEVRDALDLCLACKGCKTDCPVDVDMATYKAEFLSHHYEGRVRPAAHYTMGWLPLWARLASFAPRLVNALSHAGPLTRLGQRLGGVEPDRPVPYFADHRFTDSYRRRGPRGSGERGEVMLWPDTFTNNLHPHVAKAAVEVLEDAGYRVTIPDSTLCCGLTWISTGQLDVAERVLRRTLRHLAPHLRRGGLVVGLEPSCTAVFRADAPELFPHDHDIARLRDQTRTLAELLVDTDGWEPPKVDRDAVVQPHCHQHAVLGEDPDTELMKRAGIEPTTVSGCCGLAGNFGYESGHLDVSVACAEHELLPALREAGDDALVLADGFSCRTQVEQTDGGRQPEHLAEVLAAALRAQRGQPTDPRSRPGRPQQVRHLDRHRPQEGSPWPV